MTAPERSSFEYFEHAADIGVRGFGANPEEAFAGAAKALFSLVDEGLENVREELEEPLSCEAPGIEELFVAFLNELISLADSRRLVFRRFDIRIQNPPSGPFRLTGRAWGEAYDPARHRGTVEPKGATYTALRVGRESGRWVAQCVIDV
jgi:SHS2 domain-containing protein